MPKGWIAVDFDGTLAHYDHWRGPEHCGAPIPLMVERVKSWLREGKTVKIFTARLYHTSNPESIDTAHRSKLAIERWCLEHIGQWLEVTNVKDFGMVQLWDDRAVRIIPNTGQICCVAKRDEEETIG